MSSIVPGMACVVTFAAAAFFASSASGATPKADPDAPKPHVTVALISETSTFAPGSTAMLGLTFSIEKDWHIYWNGRNDTGMPPSAEFTLPESFTIGEWQWPAPIRHVLPGDILDHVYENRVTLLIPVKVSADAKPRAAANITAKVDWLVCNEACVPESAEVSLTLPVAPAAGKSSADAKHIADARSRVPAPFPTDAKVASISWSKDKAQIKVPGATGLSFFPSADCLELTHPIADTVVSGDKLTLRIKPGDEPALRGVLEVRTTLDKPTMFYAIDAKPVQTAAPEPASPNPPKQETQAPTNERR